jgi:cytochrome c6
MVLISFGTSATADEGAGLYNAKCASCHGKDAKGNPAMAKMFKLDNSAMDLSDKATLDKSDDQLVSVLSKGEGKMPGYEGKMSDANMKTLIAYLRGLGENKNTPSAPAAAPTAPPDSGLYMAKCASCHGKDGKGNVGMAKIFKCDAAALDLTDAATQAKPDAELTRATKQGVGKMPAYDGKLSEDQILSLTAYIKSLKTSP